MHHFARQLGSPFPLLAAVAARTKTIEIGTAVIDMRYENPMYMWDTTPTCSKASSSTSLRNSAGADCAPDATLRIGRLSA